MDKNKAFLKKDDFNKTREGKKKKLLARIFDFHLCKALSIPFIHFLLLKTYLHVLYML